MMFDVVPVRREGALLPRHVMWSGKVRGRLYVRETHDPELNRSIRVAQLLDEHDASVLPPLLDVVLLAAKPDWITLTGWERSELSVLATARAFQQSWILIPAGLDAPQ